ncbi:MAG: ABC transporter permease [Microvirga sp.]|jgi:ribose transport system permease protein|uniref:ABC transporter permease n=1 Tax=Microvirga tunisiensis TaxID=2108360 RepID=A0A5N7MM84_9HYPH|nr:ABC transporter permease [Microvirga tunisiensis]MPR09799.1 ABC transporter permease [Microvirga tunisiensis]MPR27993.1 ABC transporter permease [Microvirga tunisiensis]
MTETVLRSSAEKRRFNIDMRALSPFIALIVLIIAGALINPDFLTASNLLNVVTRSAFIAIIAVGATFVIAGGGLDLSVGSMAALTAGVMILTLNNLGGGDVGTLALGMLAAIALSAACGLANGLIVTFGRIEPFIVTLGTMGIYRSLVIWLAAGGTITMRNFELRELYRPVYFDSILGVPIPIIAFMLVAAIGALILYRTSFGRHVVALGSNEDVARYSGVPIWRVRTLTYIIQGICVGIAVLVYVPRLGSATPTTGLLWELQAITAVVIGGTALKGGIGRVWGTVVGAVILELVANIMVLSNFVSEFLVGAVQGAIIIIAMLVQRSVHRGR